MIVFASQYVVRNSAGFDCWKGLTTEFKRVVMFALLANKVFCCCHVTPLKGVSINWK